MTRQFRILALIALGAAAVTSVGHAGLLDSVKKKVTDSATHKATESADKAVAKPPAPAAEAEKTDGAKTAEPAHDGGKVSSVSSKFDFVPGDRVMFADDFTQDDLGVPARWKLLGAFRSPRWMASDGCVRSRRGRFA
jgi:hypothetical protein